ncbi:unnamed protein product [Rhizophagus irregularis]|nr:unnamed protein product [Rhizophagus irregularis]
MDKSRVSVLFCANATGSHKIRPLFDSGVDHVKNKLNIKEAIDYIAESWNNVTPTTIQIVGSKQLLDREIPTEEHLTEEQIIDMVRNEENQVEESEDDDENEEIPLISVKKAINGKYLRVIRVREINAKKQSTLDGFFDR